MHCVLAVVAKQMIRTPSGIPFQACGVRERPLPLSVTGPRNAHPLAIRKLGLAGYVFAAARRIVQHSTIAKGNAAVHHQAFAARQNVPC